jgi:hypothetical protein
MTIPWARYGISSIDFNVYGLGQGFADAVLGAVGIAVRRVATGFLATGGIAAGIGVGLLVWGGITPSSQKDQPAAA